MKPRVENRAAVPEAIPQPVKMLETLLTDATAALADLDSESLELLQVRAVQLNLQFGEAMSLDGVAVPRGARSRYRVFAEVLRSTGESLNLLRRMNGSGGIGPWDR